MHILSLCGYLTSIERIDLNASLSFFTDAFVSPSDRLLVACLMFPWTRIEPSTSTMSKGGKGE